MISEGGGLIRQIGDGLLEVADTHLAGLIVQEDINEIYDVEQAPFARGKFAAVRRAVHKTTGVPFAAKFLRRRRRAQCSAKDIGHEIAVLLLCDSKHIVKLHSVHETKTETVLILEMASGGELQALLDDDMALTESQTRTCMREVLKALQHLHKRRIAHLDLKPQNILLAGNNVEDGLKLCDFGISRLVEENVPVREILGTTDYVAPEVLQYEPLSLKTDIWSVGVLVYVLLTGCSPFGGDTKQETFLNISKCALTFPEELFEDVSPMAIDFIKSTLRIKPTDRLDIAECLQHKWLAEDASPHLELCPSLTTTVTSPHNSSYSLNNHHEKMSGSHSSTRTSMQDNSSKETSPSSDYKKYETRRSIVTEERPIELRESVASNSTLTTALMMNTASSSSSNIATATVQDAGITATTQQLNNNNKENISSLAAHTSSATVVITTQNIVKMKSVDMVERQSMAINLFPDAPTTPKVSRKAPPDSPPASVKALVQKFQQQQQHQQQQKQQLKQLQHQQEDNIDDVDSATAAAFASCISTATATHVASTCHPECGAGVCGGAAGVHNVGRKSLAGIEQGIIC